MSAKLKSCQFCPQTFKRNEHLARHTLIHSGEKKHKCNTCSRHFSRLDALKRHTRLHSGLSELDSNQTIVNTMNIPEPKLEAVCESVFGLMNMARFKSDNSEPMQQSGRQLLSIPNLILAE